MGPRFCAAELIARRGNRLDSSSATNLTQKWLQLPNIVVWLNSNTFVQNMPTATNTINL